MIDVVKRLQNSQPIRYIFIGGVSYMVEMGALLSFAYLLHFSSALSVAYSFWIGLIVSFLLQKYIAFSSKSNHKKVIGRQALLYGLLILFNYGFTIAFVSKSIDVLGLEISRTLALIITTLWNYFIYKEIFKTAH